MWGVTSMARGSDCRARFTEEDEEEEEEGGGLGMVLNPEDNIATWCLQRACM